MKGKSPLFYKHHNSRVFRLNLQLFAQKRVSDAGLAIQNSLSNKKLKNLVGELYREGATVGDGSAMAAANEQVLTGKLTGGKDHILKIQERITNLNNIMRREILNDFDSRYAKELLNKMKKSLKGEY